MKRSFIALVLLTCSSPSFAADGKLELRYVSGAWQVSKPDNSTLNISASTTCGFQEALNEAASSAHPLHYYGQGRANPCTVNNVSITRPAAEDLYVYCYGVHINFINMGTKPGFIWDRQRYGGDFCHGSRIRYSGTGPINLIRPATVLTDPYWGIAFGTSIGRKLQLGLQEATGGTPRAMIEIDTSALPSATNNQQSSFAVNDLEFMLECRMLAQDGVRLKTPAVSPHPQVIAENTFRFRNIEACTNAPINIGNNSTLDDALGTNLWIGNIAHQGTASGSAAIISNTFGDMFWLHSANNYSGPSNYIVRFGTNARDNLIWTRQMYGGAIAPVLDQNVLPTTNPNLVGAPLPPPPTSNFEGTSGVPTGSTAMGTFTYVDRSWQIDNNKTVTKLWLNTTIAGTYPLKIVRRNSAGNYDVVAAASVVHGGGGLQSVTLGSAYAVPNDGKEYFVGVYTSGVSHPALDNKARSYVAADVNGNGVTMTEQGPQTGWYILAVGVTYQ